MYQALYRKWRPRTFDDVVGQSHITDTLKRQVSSGRLSHAYLFTGTRGTGKTTCAKILARAVNCEHPVDGNPCNQCPSCIGIENGSILDVLELDAASNNGVDQVRALRDEAIYTPAAVRKRVYIVDEVHMLSTAAFNALLKILEEPPAHLMFILATTELHKVPATIRSRCQQFSFKRILPGDIARRLSYVAGEEGLSLSTDGAALLARLADGGLRDALSLLDQCITPDGAIGEGEILDALGLAGNLETAQLMQSIAQRDVESALERLARLYGGGKEIGSLLGELSALARDLLIRKTAPKGGGALLTGGYDEWTLRQLSEQLNVPRLIQILTCLQETVSALPRSGNRRTDAELCLIRLCDEQLDGSLAGLSARLTRLEEALAQGKTLEVAGEGKAQLQQAPEQTAGRQEEGPPWACEEKRSAASPVPIQELPCESAKAPSASHTGSGGARDFWSGLASSLKGKIPPPAYHFLNNPSLVQGVYQGGLLTLWVDSELTRRTVGKPEVLAQIQQAAQARFGEPVRVKEEVGKPPESQTPAPNGEEPTHDKLDELLAFGKQFGNITIQE
jgi:DNA polymerase-3 subunit gamma/tau